MMSVTRKSSKNESTIFRLLTLTMKTRKLAILFGLFLVFIGTSNTHAQIGALFHAAVDEAEEQVSNNIDKEETIDYLRTAWSIYNSGLYPEQIDISDLGRLNRLTGNIYHYYDEPLEAISFYEAAILNYRSIGATSDAGAVWPFMALSYTYLNVTNSNPQLPEFENRSTEEVVYLVTEDIVVLSENKRRVTIHAGLVDGLYPESRGQVYATYRDEYDDRALDVLGTIDAMEVDSFWTTVDITLTNPGGRGEILPNDVLAIPVRFPVVEFESIFTKNAKLGIFFKDLDDFIIYDLRMLMRFDSEELEEELLQLILDEVYRTARIAKSSGWIESNPQLLDEIEEGRFKGRNTYEVLQTATLEDVYSFLSYVEEFPANYIGTPQNSSELFATWVLNGGPMGAEEFIRLFAATQSKADMRALIDQYEASILKNEWMNEVEVKAENLSKDGFADSALYINNRIQWAADIFDSDLRRGWAFFNRGKILSDIDWVDSTIYYYQRGYEAFRRAGFPRGMAFCYNNIGYEYKALDQLLKAKKYYLESLELKMELWKSDSSTTNMQSVAKASSGLGGIYYGLTNYDSAAYYYNQSIEFFLATGTLTYQKLAASSYDDLAEVYTDMGKYPKAIELYEQQIEEYRNLGDQDKIMDVKDDLAWTYFQKGDYRTAYNIYYETYQYNLELEQWDAAGFSLSNCAQAVWNLGQLDSAVTFHTEAIRLRSIDYFPSGVAFSTRKLGTLYSELGDFNRAIDYLTQADSIYTSIADSVNMAVVRYDIGDLYYNMTDYPKAEESYVRALNVFEPRGMQSYIGDCYSSLGSVALMEKDYPRAMEYHEKALKIRKNIGEKAGEMYSLVDKALVLIYGSFEYEAAEKLLNEALVLAEETNSGTYRGFCLENIGYLYSNSGDPAKAAEYFQEALEIYESTGDVSYQSTMLYQLGYVEVMAGNFDNALNYYNQGVSRAEKAGLFQKVADGYTFLVEYYYIVSNFEAAFEMANKAIDIYTENQNDYGLANAYLILGNTYNYVGNIAQTIAFYQKADSIYQVVGDFIGEATVNNNIGTIYFFQGDYDNALRSFYRSENIMDSVSYFGDLRMSTKWNIGEVYYEKGILPESRKWLEEGYAIAVETGNRRKKNGIAITLSKLEIKAGSYARAIELLTEAHREFEAIGETMGITETATQLGKAYLGMENYTEAARYLDKAISMYEEIDINKYLWEPLYLRSQIYSSRDDIQASIEYLKRAVDVIEDLKGRLVGDPKNQKLFAKAQDKIVIYETLVAQLIAVDSVNTAFFYQEKMNIEGLREQTRGNERGAALLGEDQANEQMANLELKVDGIYNQLLKEKSKPASERSEAKIKKLEEMMTVAEMNYQNFVDSIMRDNQDAIVNFSSSINPRDLDYAREALPDEAAVVEYLATENQLIIFVATYEKLTAKVIDVTQENLYAVVNGFYQMITNTAELSEVKKQSEQLYDLMIAPILSEIEGKTKIALVPTGQLYKLPIQALGHTLPDGRFEYIIEQRELFYINHTRFINMNRPWRMDDVRILAFGNSDKTLPFAEKEVEMIAGMFDSTTVYIQDAATEDLAKNGMTQYPVVHFATHGNLDPVMFKNTYLTMAPNPEVGEDGRLTVEEIRMIRSLRNCQLIVLSACNTAVNDEQVEGWVNNPAKEFITKGAKSVVATLWMVDDAATGLLMEDFYALLKEKNQKSTALQQAQINVLRNPKFEHPYYWSAFELIGEYK